MTDLPPPPAPASAASTPPPPPPPIAPPPGRAIHAPNATHATPLQRVGKLATAVTALTAVVAAFTLASIWASEATQSDAEALLTDSITEEEFLERAMPYLLMTAVQFVAITATAVVTMIWMFRVAQNHRTMHRGGTWGPGWAIGGWFLPPLLYVIPLLMFRELWKASDPDVPVGGDWRSRPVTPVITLWFLLYSLVPLVIFMGQGFGSLAFDATEREIAREVIDGRSIVIIGAAVSIAGAAAYVLLVRGLTARHVQLTGELRARR